MFEWIRITFNRIFKWVAGSDESKRADFAAVTDSSIKAIEMMQKVALEQQRVLKVAQDRLDVVELRLDHHRELREEAMLRIDHLEAENKKCDETVAALTSELEYFKTANTAIRDAGILLTPENIELLKKVINKKS